MRPVLAIAAAILVGACASGPVYSDYASSIPSLQSSQGRIWFYRTNAYATIIQPEVKLNGEIVGKAVPQGFFYADRAPGEYTISTSSKTERDLVLALEAGEQKYVRFDPQETITVGTIKLVLVETEDGQKAIQSTRFTGAVTR